MSVSALSSPSNGTVTSKGKTVVKTIAAQTNDPYNVGVIPNSGRIMMREANGTEYTVVPSITVNVNGSAITLIKEIA